MIDNAGSPKVYKVDTNHTGIRLGVLVAIVCGVGVSALVVNPVVGQILQLSGITKFFSAIAIMIAMTIASGYSAESLLKRLWPSGRELVLTSDSIRLKNRGNEASINWAKLRPVLKWYFKISRGRTWVPKGWVCAAIQLDDGSSVIDVYTFMSLTDAAALPGWANFVSIVPVKSVPAEIREEASVLALRSAEENRWAEGAEVEQKSLVKILETISKYELTI